MNMPSMLVQEEISQELRSWLKSYALKNMYCALVHALVSHALMSSLKCWASGLHAEFHSLIPYEL